MKSIAESDTDSATKLNGLSIGNKVGFEILARMYLTTGIDKVADIMV